MMIVLLLSFHFWPAMTINSIKGAAQAKLSNRRGGAAVLFKSRIPKMTERMKLIESNTAIASAVL
jgi:hypothetical protein